ncbi:MAG TPA: TonB-dependent receptor, partial [Bacteroidia bacterium]|nr:TonB-dependent receptor [Bacteroidia bacterium]
VERIEIVEGPLSVNYGTNALAGAVNLITKKSQGNTFSVQSDSYYESAGHYNFTGRVGGRHKNLVASFAGGRNFFDGWSSTHKPFYVDWQPIADSTRFDQWKPREQVFGSLYVCRFYQRGSIGLMADVFDEKITNRGLPRLPYGENAFDDFYYTRRLSASLNWKHRFSDSISIQIIGAASDFRRIKNTYFRNLITLEDQLVEGSGLQDTSGFSLYMLRASITRGGDSLRFRFESGVDLNTETTTGLRIAGRTQWIGDYAVFATAEYRPWQKLVVRSGLRYAVNTAYKSPLIPSVHIRSDLNEHFFIRASFASGFRAPSLKELYFYFVDINHNIRGNENLRAEASKNFIASLNWQQKNEKYKINLSVSGFYNDIHNLISLALVQGTEYTYVNIGRYKTTGGGLNADFRNEHLRLNGGFSYTGRYNFLHEEFSLPQFTWSPEARMSVTWVPDWHDLAFAVFYKYTGITPGFTVDENNTVYNTSIRDYHTADATISKKWLGGKLITEAGVRNIANVQNVQSTIDGGSAHSGSAGSMSVGTGRQYFFSLRWSLSFDKKTE